MRCHGNSRLILQALPALRMLAVMLFCLASSKQQAASSKQQAASSTQQTARGRQHAAAVHQRIHYAMQLRITSPHRIHQIETW
ncbi:hypothetical protein VDR13_07065 [Xanthomonas campestris pv. campestris]|uniref:hypothetical protein n=1 Tax=Xanthomonas campestris TaxID=339 RepID=UPI002B2323F7|nr:hypothetical protein [Xanthomonas campestris]MEB1766289.1 hypothetical protein [Xanthomonas campestris pv. campestris]